MTSRRDDLWNRERMKVGLTIGNRTDELRFKACSILLQSITLIYDPFLDLYKNYHFDEFFLLISRIACLK